MAIGLISYSLYLWHWPFALARATRVTALEPLEAGLHCALALILATLTYGYVETPFRRVRNRRSGPVLGLAVIAGALAMAVALVGLRIHTNRVHQARRPRDHGRRGPARTDRILPFASLPAALTAPRRGLLLHSRPRTERNHLGRFKCTRLAAVRLGPGQPRIGLRRELHHGPVPTPARRPHHPDRPQLRDSAPKCIRNHALDSCALPRAEFDTHAHNARELLLSVVTRYDGKVQLIDPVDHFCNDTLCPVLDAQGRSLHWDDDHISATAARGFGRGFVERRE